ncbi:thioesterase [Caproiciproducens sp. NJN-50]|uniref:thioesterase family protein n=1 Tax=Acutalibacteraceae TaxID=3082771 RepID=UPI000FFE18BC|nr:MULTISPECIES: thioesterase family protein [Acutalibacteraceae]QAT48312.1 thioesterase [Caproiciproducens sp. NJN-50]
MPDTRLTKEFTVSQEMLASRMGSGLLPVLATPIVAAFFENTAMEIAAGYLSDGETTVGSKITVEHLAPTAPGCKVTVTAELEEHEKRTFRFRLEARDNAGVVATGTHVRVSVAGERFMKKAEERKNTVAQ